MSSDLPLMTPPSRVTATPPPQTGEGNTCAHCGTVITSPPMVVRCMKRLYLTGS